MSRIEINNDIPCTFSAARSSVVKEHVQALLKQRKVTYGDFQLFEFEDPFLQENVKSISICDTELVPQERKVSSAS